jgi:hypothetical protein
LFFEFYADEFAVFKSMNDVVKNNKKDKISTAYENMFLAQYSGFEIVSEINKFCELFELDGVRTYSVGERKDLADGKREYSYEFDEFYGDYEEDGASVLHLLLVDCNDRRHPLFVSDPERLTGAKACPHCHTYIQKNVFKCEYQYKFSQHKSQCSGPKERQVRLEESKPFAPVFQKQKLFSYLVARGIGHLFKPTQYYMCWDLETLEKKMETQLLSLPVNEHQTGSRLESLIRAFSIAVSFHGNND